MAVKLESFQGRLRLRWSYQGKRYGFSLGLGDTQLGRTIAQGRVAQIETDLITGQFDETLARYRTGNNPPPPGTKITALDLFDRFMTYKLKSLDPRTIGKYRAVKGKVTALLQGEQAGIDDEIADRFRLGLGTSPRTQKEYLSLLSSCWQWGAKESLVSSDPWGEVVKRVKVPPKQRPRPFTKQEIAAITKGFRQSKHYGHYGDFVEFLFSTGCRTGEAIGLRWGHLPEDCRKVWIGESVSRGVRKPTKTNRSREFRVTDRLASMLLARRPENPQLDGLVFPAPEGGPIDDHNFRNRAWVQVLKAAGVPYRKPYNTRHTFISHAIAGGLNPMAIAQMTGHDPEVLFAHYAADIQGGLQLPDIF
ncbi:MAG: tyrosine-type recombinase/integrase [Alkalinema sp. RU_4_3]|nr:tyrosine-type recombinase/integrase [Alkalinema sp. RU_4_3]